MKIRSAKSAADARDAKDGYVSGKAGFQVEGEEIMRALVLHLEFCKLRVGAGQARSAEARLEEAVGLALAIGLEIAAKKILNIGRIHPSTLIGVGQVEEIGLILKQQECGLVIFNGTLSPGQQRNLERAWGAKVVDRTGLILEIFGARAKTREGRLQVDLAHLNYQKSRLVRSWTHLERQRGGVGFMGGPGERQIESDRRILQDKINKLERQLERVKNTRKMQRKARKRIPSPTVTLVGYTNAGKSTLFNRLTKAGVMAKDLLFSTLDSTMRKLVLPHARQVILSDTVGFISDLPTELVAAFHATLEEVIEADLIVHVRDTSHQDAGAQADDVIAVLEALGINELQRDHRLIEVWNKCDLLDREAKAVCALQADRADNTVQVSALTGEGVDDLLALIEEHLARLRNRFLVRVPPGNGAGLSWVYRAGEVLERNDLEDGTVELIARLPEACLCEAEAKRGLKLRSTDEDNLFRAAE